MPARLTLRMSRQEAAAHLAAKEAEWRARRRDRLRQARALGRHTAAQWDALVDACGYACTACGERPTGKYGLTKDHIVAVAKGGSDSIENIQPLCGYCNAVKQDEDWGDLRPADWRLHVFGAKA